MIVPIWPQGFYIFGSLEFKKKKNFIAGSEKNKLMI